MTIIILVLAIVLMGCSSAQEDNDNGEVNIKAQTEEVGILNEEERELSSPEVDQIVVYYTDEAGEFLIPINLEINSTTEGANVAVQRLLAGPSVEFVKPSIASGTKIIDLYVKNNKIYVDLTHHLKDVGTAKEANIAVEALLLTLKPFIGDKSVQILIEGETQGMLAGEIDISTSLKPPSYINFVGEEEIKGNVITVYYTERNAMYLVPVSYSVGEQDILRTTAEALVKGPGEGETGTLIPTVWPGTELLEVRQIDNVAEINLSKEAIAYGGGSATENLFVSSLLLTLTGIEGIDSVQILIAGEKVDTLPEGTQISAPITPQDSYYNTIRN